MCNTNLSDTVKKKDNYAIVSGGCSGDWCNQ